jgi:hypothetical protein
MKSGINPDGSVTNCGYGHHIYATVIDVEGSPLGSPAQVVIILCALFFRLRPAEPEIVVETVVVERETQKIIEIEVPSSTEADAAALSTQDEKSTILFHKRASHH